MRLSGHKVSLILLLRLFASGIRAQDNRWDSLLAVADSTAHAITSSIDEHFFSAESEVWLEETKDLIDVCPIDSLLTYRFEHLISYYTPDSIFCIGIKHSEPNLSEHLLWIAKSKYGTFSFHDKNTDTDFNTNDITLRLSMEILANVESDENKEKCIEIVNERVPKIITDYFLKNKNISWLPRLTLLKEENNTFAIATYCATYSDLSYDFFGLIASYDKKCIINIETLNDCTKDVSANNPEKSSFNAKRWYGAVYYNMIPIKIDNKTYYTLLGYKGTDGLIKTRVIEVLHFKGKSAQFGAPIFIHEKSSPKRRIFKYSSQSNMMFRWEAEKKMIIFDHLSAPSSLLSGQWQHYGSDMSFDAYKASKNGWLYIEDVDVTKFR